MELVFTHSKRESELAKIFKKLGRIDDFERICEQYELTELKVEYLQEVGKLEQAEEVILGEEQDDEFSSSIETNLNSKACNKCNNLNPDNAKYCFECGNALETRCGECNELVSNAKYKFCPNCGNKL